MRKIILSINITKDGFIAAPDGSLDWHFPYWTHEMADSLGRLLSNCDTILLGRNTYHAFAAYWAPRENDLSAAGTDIPLAYMMNRYTKVVVSGSLHTLTWQPSMLITKTMLRDLKKLKEERGKHIVVLGSCQLVSYLIRHDLIDEYHLWVHPINIRRGRRLSKLPASVYLAAPGNEEQFSCGVIRMSYYKKILGTELIGVRGSLLR